MSASGIGRQTVHMAAALGCAQVLTAVAYAIAARTASPSEFGAVVSLVALATVLGGVVDFGLNAFLIRETARGTIGIAELRQRNAQKVMLAALIGSALAVGGAVATLGSGLHLLIIGTYALWVLFMAVAAAQATLRATMRTRAILLAALVDRGVLVAIISLASAGQVGVELGLVGGLAAGMAANVLICLALAHDLPRLPLRATTWWRAWRGAGGFGAISVFGAVPQLDVTIAALVGGPAAAGHYGAVSRWTSPLILPATALSQAGLVHAAAAGGTVRARARGLGKSRWVIVLGILACAMVAGLSQPLTEVILGSEYSDSAAVLAILALGSIFALIGQPLSMLIQASGHERAAARLLGVGVVVRLGGAAIFGSLAGAIGVAVAFLLHQFLIFALLGGFLFLAGRQRRRQAPSPS